MKTPKGEVVVNQDGTQSHKSRGKMDNINKKAINFLNKIKGFRIPIIPLFMIDPCLLDPNIYYPIETQACPDA